MNFDQKNKIELILHKISGALPSRESVEKLEFLTQSLNAKTDDSIIILLGIFEAYYSVLSKTPLELNELILAESKKFEENQQKLQENLISAVTKKISYITKKEKISSVLKWTSLSVVISSIILIGSSYVLHNKVYEIAFNAAYHKAYANYQFQNEWITSKLGQKAFKFAQNNDLESIINCSGEGWIVEEINEKKACLPQGSGWYME